MPHDPFTSPSTCESGRPPEAGPAWCAAAEAGVDMNLLEHSLRLSPWERLQDNQRSLGLVLALQAAGNRLRERSPGHP
jgi:hypothetical protein